MSVGAGSKSRGRILIVDDNRNLAENIAEIFELEGYDTAVASTGQEAIIKAWPAPDVVITDYRLPDTNGAKVVAQLRQMGLRVRAIVMSAYTDEGTMGDAKEAGAAFLGKPLDMELLGRLVRNLEGSA